MSIHQLKGSKISTVVNIIPAEKLDNLQEDLIPEAERNSMVEHTGIRYRRRFSRENQSTQYLFKMGIEEILMLTQWSSESVDALICITQTPDTHIPAVSCVLHDEFEFSPSMACFDINLGCSGYVYGLHQAYSLLQSKMGETGRAILCCGDVTTILEEGDKSTQPIFSDGVSVTAIEFARDAEFYSYFNLETMGSGKTAISSFYNENKQEVMKLNGMEVFNYSVQFVPNHINQLLKHVPQSIALTGGILHQANKIINSAIAKRISLTGVDFPSTLYDFGNMASASIPVTLVDYLQNKNLSKVPPYILLSGFGVGFSMATAVVSLSGDLKLKMIEI
ncbi:MAG: hypothetical protein NBV77_06590 [Bacteroidia bacterium]|nr:hypothetical protein [Bacteroidia bacterium]